MVAAIYPSVPLGAVVTHRKQFIEIDDTAIYKRCRVQLHAAGIVLRDTVSGWEIKTKQQQICRAGEFLVAEIDAKVGGFGIVPQELDGAIVSSHYFLYTIDEATLDRRFLGYYVRTPTFRDQVAAQGTTNYAAIRPRHVLEYTIPLPPLPEQRRIVARIVALAERIEEIRQLRRSATEEVDSLVVSIHLQLAGHRVIQLGDLLVLDEDRCSVAPDREYPQVGVRGFGQGLFPRETLTGAQTTYREFNRLYEGALVLSQVKGWEGAVAVCPSELAGRFVSPEYRTFRCVPDKCLPDYMSALVATPWFHSHLSTLTRGVGARRERIRPEHFLRLQLPVPAIGDQTTAVSSFQQLAPVRRLQARTDTELDALQPAVLDRAFRGEL